MCVKRGPTSIGPQTVKTPERTSLLWSPDIGGPASVPNTSLISFAVMVCIYRTLKPVVFQAFERFLWDFGGLHP
jgi:hypothetical protein